MERTKLKLYRLRQKMSQAAFAKAIGYSRAHYARVENGQQEVPLKMILTISDFSGMTIDEVRELTKQDKTVEE